MTGDLRAKPRGSSTICLPIDQQRYVQIIDSPAMFREWIDKAILQHPELFPEAIALGYELKDSYSSKKLKIRQRRIACKTTTGSVGESPTRRKEAFTVKPSFVMPYVVGLTEDVEDALFLRAFGVPFWALARVFGKDPMYWYRLEIGLGRNSIVGTTLHQAEIPKDLVADEHHQTRDGMKNYVATTVGGGCCLGAELSQTAGADDLTNACWCGERSVLPTVGVLVNGCGNGWRSPAERLNKHRYHDNWLQNLLVSASLAGYRRRSTPQNQ